MISIVLPTYNEGENIGDMINSLYDNIKQPLEVVVVDDDSPDGTWEIAGKFADKGVKVVRRTDARGLATAIDRGIKESSGDVVGWMDADMCMPPSLLPVMIEGLEKHDIVIGSRYVKGGRDARGFWRVLTSRTINLFSGLLLGLDIKDSDSGFAVMKKDIFDTVRFPAEGYGDYFIELMYKCKKAGYSVKEVPYVFRDREKGESKTALDLSGFFKLGIGYLTRVIRLRFSRKK